MLSNLTILVSSLVISVLTLILSSWTVHNFRLLQKNMDRPDFVEVCNVSKDSVKRGHQFASLMLFLSIAALIVSSYGVFSNVSGKKLFTNF